MKHSRRVLLAYTAVVALCSLVVLGGMLLSPSEPGSSVFLGFSLTRLVLAAGLFSIFVLFLLLFLKAFRDEGWTETVFEQWFGGGQFSQVLAWIAGLGFGLGWSGFFLPAYRAGVLEPHWERLQPILAFILIASLATLAVFLSRRIEFSDRPLKLSSTARMGLVLFLITLPVLGWMLLSGYGIYSPEEDFWYGAGVPLLASQWILALLGGVFFMLVGWSWNAGRKDLVVFLLLYAVTAYLWANEPLQRSFLFTRPRPPNEVLYPFSDAAYFDAGSQFALIGQGIFVYNSPFTERSLYLSFLVYLHSLFGQDYELLMAAQAAIFAIFPSILYSMGRSLNMRSVGFVTALIAMFRGINSIAASNLIDLANPKMILTDFPAAIGVALIILFTCEWLKQPQQKWHYAIWVGGAIGLTLMLRTNALMLLAFVPILALLKLAPRWKNWLAGSLLVAVAVVVFTLPWELRTLARGGTMYSSIVTKIQEVIRTRYTPASEPETFSPLEKSWSALTFQHSQVVFTLSKDSELAQAQPCSAITCFAPKHFLHNTILSILVLPTSPILDDLSHTVKEANPYWQADWQGSISLASLFFLVGNVFLIVLGVSIVWKHKGLVGLIPLAVFMVYNLSNAFARTSGGRYIVPMDWIPPLYYAAGLLFLVSEAAKATTFRLQPLLDPESQKDETLPAAGPTWHRAVLILAILLTIGSVIPLSEKLHTARYAGFDMPASLKNHASLITEAGLDLEQVNAFLGSPSAEMLVGRTLYPRSYKTGQGEITFFFYPYIVMDFPRTGFFLIGPEGQDSIILAGEEPDYLPHAADALVIGCRQEEYVDAILVIILDESRTVHTRSPMPELTCPLKQPVCENNNTCE